jgi:hypothetical protein
MLKILLFFTLCFTILNADESINIHEQYFKRSHQYPTNGYQKIVVFSPIRTGSTIVFNVLKFLFENQLFFQEDAFENPNPHLILTKTHTLPPINPSDIIFCTIRNPEDTCFSTYRVMNPGKFKSINEEALDYAIDTYLSSMQAIDDLLQKKLQNVVLLKYEEFDSKLGFLFHQIENLFNIEICEMDRTLMEEAFDKTTIALFTKKIESFMNYDAFTHFHGFHIESDEFSKEEQVLIRNEIKKRLLGKCDFLNKYGYAL